ncbi:MAG: arsenical pump-driving ATPase [Phycisphaerae bacterium]|nr:arsenical pump-driving ATPase [Phycisphaerae bacterium]
MDFLTSPTRYLFFTGKGGVGKTSLACAVAVNLADRGKRVLLVSTDPASNLDDVFGIRLLNTPTPVPGVAGLAAVNVDPEAAAQAYRERVVGPYRGVLPKDAVRHMEEQLSGSCTVEIAAFDEFTGLLTNNTIAGAYDHIVFDTAPTGHTLRLLALPAAWSDFLNTNTNGSSCLGPLSGLNAQKERYEATVAALADAKRTTFVMVARAEASALAEADRSGSELAALGLKNQHLVINGVFMPDEPGDVIADAMAARHRAALRAMPDGIASLPRTVIPLKGHNFVGVDAIRGMLRDQAPDSAPHHAAEAPSDAVDLPPLAALIDEIEAAGHGAVMTMGKGGVGKTTIAAAIAVELARRGHAVHLTTTDPAAHITSAINGAQANLTVDRIDPVAETKAYRDGVLAASAKTLDAAGLSLLEEDLRSPCTEEVAVFRAFARVLNEAKRRFVIIDTAPTGHTLLLLDATGSYHREMMRQMGKAQRGAANHSGTHVHPSAITTPMMRLQDPAYTKIIIVTLPENTPVLEASRLQADLRRAEIEPYAWVINGSLSATPTTDRLLRARAGGERTLIEEVRGRHARRTFLVPWQAESPVGAASLARLIGSRSQTAMNGGVSKAASLISEMGAR